jgi:hypothetical protein
MLLFPALCYGAWVHQPDTVMADYPTDGISFGFCLNGNFLCYPIYKTDAEKYEKRFFDYIGRVLAPFENGPAEDHYFSVPWDTVSNLVQDNLGDTLMIMWSAGRFRGIIRDYAFYEGFCNGDLYCVLEMLDTVPKPLSDDLTYIALRRTRFYSGPLVSYSRYKLPDSIQILLADSLGNIMREAGDTLYQEHYIAAFGIEAATLPDSFFIISLDDSMGLYSWFALYQLKLEDSLVIVPIQLPSWPHEITLFFRIDCCFDLNNDGVYEYLVDRGGMATISTVINGRFVNLWGCEYRGCG